MRCASLVIVLAGCDVVYGLEDRMPVVGDTDGDGRPDHLDLCPHIPDERDLDDDDDDIGADCDPDDTVPSVRVFYTFDGPHELRTTGSVQPMPGVLELGQLDNGLATLELPEPATHVTIDIGYAIEATAIEQTQPQGPWSELGLYTAHRAFTSDSSMRGNNCFFGIHPDGKAYLEFNEDDTDFSSDNVTFEPPVAGSSGRFRHHRTPAEVECVLDRDGDPFQSGYAVQDLAGVEGTIAISAERIVVRLDYLWIAHHVSLP